MADDRPDLFNDDVPNYWLNLFTDKTWKEFQAAGGEVTGFRDPAWNRAKSVKAGDVFVCYMVGVKRWVGLLEVVGERYRDDAPIFSEEVFPVRFAVKPLALLTAETGVLMDSLAGRLSFFPVGSTSLQWSLRLRPSLARYKAEDGEAIAAAVREAAARPVERPVASKHLQRSVNRVKLKPEVCGKAETVAVIPPTEEEPPPQAPAPAPGAEDGPSHTEIQWRLLDLGSQMGLNVWAPKPDRGKMWGSRAVGKVPRLLDKLPTSFDDGTTKTVENIDVLWLKGPAIVAAFEVEHTTSIYSGLLRMSDLLTMQPNLQINLYLVGPDDRFAKFIREVARPTFASRPKPLHTLCGFLSYSRLCERIEGAKQVLRYLNPKFIDEIADFYDPAEDAD